MFYILRYPEAFISIQLEKSALRNVISKAFVEELKKNSLLMKKPEEVVALKRTLVSDYCRE